LVPGRIIIKCLAGDRSACPIGLLKPIMELVLECSRVTGDLIPIFIITLVVVEMFLGPLIFCMEVMGICIDSVTSGANI